MEAQRRADADRLPLDRRDERLVEPRERADELAARRRCARPRAAAARSARKSPMSLPAVKTPPSPVEQHARRRRRRRWPPRSAARSARYIAPVSAFFFCGRFSVATQHAAVAVRRRDRSCELLQGGFVRLAARRRRKARVWPAPARRSPVFRRRSARARRGRAAIRRRVGLRGEPGLGEARAAEREAEQPADRASRPRARRRVARERVAQKVGRALQRVRRLAEPLRRRAEAAAAVAPRRPPRPRG